MGWFDNEDDVPVELDCQCPNTPHDKDTVWLYPHLTAPGGLAGQQLWDSGAPNVETLVGTLGATFIQHGISRWTFLDGEGKPIPCNQWNIARFAKRWDVARLVAEKANDLYSQELLAPLLARLSKSSRRGQTGASTSPSRSTSRKPRRPSKPSTTATTRPRLEVMTSSDGDSNSSPKRKSATA